MSAIVGISVRLPVDSVRYHYRRLGFDWHPDEDAMAAEKALALVVRGTDWSETSRITTLFTREFGKVRALAKGGRRLKSNFDCAFDLLSVCRIVFLRKAHGGLDLLTEARMEEQFPVLRNNLGALYAGYYVAELLADGTQDYDPHPASSTRRWRACGDWGRRRTRRRRRRALSLSGSASWDIARDSMRVQRAGSESKGALRIAPPRAGSSARGAARPRRTGGGCRRSASRRCAS
jgi:hypothetical protein